MNHYIESGMKPMNIPPRFKLCWNPREKQFDFQLEDDGFIEVP